MAAGSPELVPLWDVEDDEDAEHVIERAVDHRVVEDVGALVLASRAGVHERGEALGRGVDVRLHLDACELAAGKLARHDSGVAREPRAEVEDLLRWRVRVHGSIAGQSEERRRLVHGLVVEVVHAAEAVQIARGDLRLRFDGEKLVELVLGTAVDVYPHLLEIDVHRGIGGGGVGGQRGWDRFPSGACARGAI